MHARGEAFVHSRHHDALAEVIMQDATPLKTSSMHVSAAVGHHSQSIIRKGRQGREWLVERVLLLDALAAQTVVMSEPRLMLGKSAACHHAAGVALWQGARTIGHLGPLITHGVWDRAIKSPCARLQLQRAAAWRLHHSNFDEDEASSAWLWHWVTSAGCAAHDFTNALRWANLQFFGSRQLMKRMWIVVEALRSSLDQLVVALPLWLEAHLQYEDFVSDVDLDMLWSLLGVPDEMRAEFVDLELRFEGDALKISSRFALDPEAPQRVTNCFMYLFQFQGWSDTRWGAVGRCTRRLMSCLLLGLTSLVAHLRSDASQSDYFIQGFANLDEEIIAMVPLLRCAQAFRMWL